MAIARWRGELDEERVQAVLREPVIVNEAVEHAMAGHDRAAAKTGDEPRFERREERAGAVPAT